MLAHQGSRLLSEKVVSSADGGSGNGQQARTTIGDPGDSQLAAGKQPGGSPEDASAPWLGRHAGDSLA